MHLSLTIFPLKQLFRNPPTRKIYCWLATLQTCAGTNNFVGVLIMPVSSWYAQPEFSQIFCNSPTNPHLLYLESKFLSSKIDSETNIQTR